MSWSSRLAPWIVLFMGCSGTLAVAAEPPTPRAVAAQIDQLITERWAADKITPTIASDDAEYLRRVYLDLCGRIPPASEVRDFLADTSPDKREKLVDRLLESPTYIINYTNVWRAIMLPEASSDETVRFFLPGFEAWLRSRLAENRNYAQIAEELLTLPLNGMAMNDFQQPEEPSPLAFYRAKQGKPEEIAGASARMFLGVRIECAQCHNHPFDKWKREEFWSYAAFFKDTGTLQSPQNAVQAVIESGLGKVGTRSIKIPETETVVSARFLTGEEPDWSQIADSRANLSRWVTSPGNPYFAKAAVNRVWTHHFGIGIVDPVDDFSDNNPASHPEILDLLAREFVAHQYDFKFLIRTLTATRVYQLSSIRSDASQDNPRQFARMPVRGLTAEQIFDSLAQATGYLQPFDPEQPLNFNQDQARQEFLETFETDTGIERQSTILQALALMNGTFASDATSVQELLRSRNDKNGTLVAIAEAPFFNDEQRIEALFLTTLSRFPTDAEKIRFLAYLQTNAATDVPARPLADLFWTLLNTTEFLSNH
ncbi:MAG: DUF1553 domain-containing protein [Planctomycetota bacterium]|nr:MAG: DUF1553 domain-containing protein [Planctomycetota bacterium]